MSAELRWLRSPEHPVAVTLILHGGADRSRAAVHWYDHAVLRMLPLARAAGRAHAGIAVAVLRNEIRGWNGAEASPLPGARDAVDAISARYGGLPLGLVGHSMGGRVATHLLPDTRVRAVLGLAPWIDRCDVVDLREDQSLLLVHGENDRITAPAASRKTAARLGSEGRRASYLELHGGDHPMLRRWRTWDDVVATWAAWAVVGAQPAYRVDPAVAETTRRAVQTATIGEL